MKIIIIELVIKIPEEVYKHILKAKSVPDMSGIDIVNTINAVKNGVLLPKGHDRLIEESEIERVIDGVFYSRNIYYPDMFLNILKDQCITFLEADRSEE